MASDYLGDFLSPALRAIQDDTAKKREATLKPLQEICARHEAAFERLTQLKKEHEIAWRQPHFQAYSPREAQREANLLQLAKDVGAAEAAYQKLVPADPTPQVPMRNGDIRSIPLVVSVPPCCQMRVDMEAQLAAEQAVSEAPIREQLDELAAADRFLIALLRRQEYVTAREAHLKAELEGFQAERISLADDQRAGRRAWQEAAGAASFSGRPTVDLPARPAPPPAVEREVRVKREEKSLVLGMNTTKAEETEIFDRDARDRALLGYQASRSK